MSNLNLLLYWTWFSDGFKFNEYKNVAATKENETEIGALKTTHARNIICRKKMGCILQGGRWWVLYHKVYRVRECAQKRFNIIISIYLKRICCSIWPIIIQMSKIELMIKSIWYIVMASNSLLYSIQSFMLFLFCIHIEWFSV